MSEDSNLVSEKIENFEKRKQDHIELALLFKNQTQHLSNFDKIELIHQALPELDFQDVQIQVRSLKKNYRSPFFVSSMTAGHKGADSINYTLAKVCNQMQWSLAVGSQRRELFDPTEAKSWQKIRSEFPDLSMMANIGISQAIQVSSAQIEALVQNLRAEAIYIHLNVLQELIQPEGTPQFKNALDCLKRLSKELSVPVLVKETGCGFSKEALRDLNSTGIAAVDISGLGGTHWGRIEGDRAGQDFIRSRAAQVYADWGISTIDSLLNSQKLSNKYEIWASGGIRNGLDAAKCLALGAKRIGIAQAILKACMQSEAAALEIMQAYEYELKMALLLTGSKNLEALQETWRMK